MNQASRTAGVAKQKSVEAKGAMTASAGAAESATEASSTVTHSATAAESARLKTDMHSSYSIKASEISHKYASFASASRIESIGALNQAADMATDANVKSVEATNSRTSAEDATEGVTKLANAASQEGELAKVAKTTAEGASEEAL